MWERLLEAWYFLIAFTVIGAAIEATTLPPTSGNETLFSPEWLEEQAQIISKLLNVHFQKLSCVSKMKQLLTNFAIAEVVTETDFLNRIR